MSARDGILYPGADRLRQLDLFDAEPAPVPIDSIIGLSVRMPGACARCRCRCRLATTVAGTPPHKTGLRCAGCGVHRGWIGEETLRFLQSFAATFGRPTRPIDLIDFRHAKSGGAMRT
jgi:hypothetical protein